jgi:hypothetical protein
LFRDRRVSGSARRVRILQGRPSLQPPPILLQWINHLQLLAWRALQRDTPPLFHFVLSFTCRRGSKPAHVCWPLPTADYRNVTATACTHTSSILFVDRLHRCCTVCRSYNKKIDCALGSATFIDTVPRTSLLFLSTVPVSGCEWECGAGECSPKSAAAPATVSGESYVIMPLGTSGPGKATRDKDPQARRPAVSRGHTRPCRPGCADVSRTASAWRDAGRLGSR